MKLIVHEYKDNNDEVTKRYSYKVYYLEDVSLSSTFGEIFGPEFEKKHIDRNEKGCFFLPYDKDRDEIIRVLEFDDFYGEVKFDVPASELTIEQLLIISGNSKNTIYIIPTGGVGGGGPEFNELINVIVDSYQIFNNLIIDHPALMLMFKETLSLTWKRRNEIKQTLWKFLKKYDERNVFPLSFIDYINSKNVWTMEELKLRFNEKDERVLNDLMTLSFYQFNERTQEYYPMSNEIRKIEINQISLEDQVEIVAYYVLMIKDKEKIQDLNIDYLSSRLEQDYDREIIIALINEIDIIYKEMSANETEDKYI